MTAAVEEFSEAREVGLFDGTFCRAMKKEKWQFAARIQFAFRGLPAGQWFAYWTAWQEGASC